jgi:hypothetical protein
MKKLFSLICAMLFIFCLLPAQNFKSVTVKAGTKIKDYFPLDERYMYPQFIEGQITLTNGTSGSAILNYNILLGEIEFINGRDTMVINRKSDLDKITIVQDTFIYRSGYYKMIHGGRLKVCIRDRIKLIEILKQGAMGTVNRTSAGETFNSTSMNGRYTELALTDDMVFQRKIEFFILTLNDDLIPFKKKNVIELYLNKKTEIEKYLKSNKVNFDSQADILRFSDWLSKFTNKI